MRAIYTHSDYSTATGRTEMVSVTVTHKCGFSLALFSSCRLLVEGALHSKIRGSMGRKSSIIMIYTVDSIKI
jgi:hypothetical protein